MDKILVILGPTATGKTDTALRLAALAQGELVSCDSRQVYENLDIGTGKLPGGKVKVKKGKGFWEINGIKIWLYDVADPKKQYTVADYVKQAEKVIKNILKRGKLPIIVGGTGLYLKALLEGLPNLEIPVNQKLRGELQKLSLEDLQNKLQKLSLGKWEQLNNSDRNNQRRLLRSLELLHMYPYSNEIRNPKHEIRNWEILKIGLMAPREVLNKRIDWRLVFRVDQGMIEEAENLHKNGLTFKRMKELGLEYGLLAKLLEGEINKNQFIDQLSVNIHQYAKRQMTWFKAQKEIFWFDLTDKNWQPKIEKLIFKWYDKRYDAQN